MRQIHSWAIGAGLVLLSRVAMAAQLEDMQNLVGTAGAQLLVIVMILAAIFVYFMRPSLDKRETPLRTVLGGATPIYSVAADALVTECTRKMTDRKIGALMVMDHGKVIGIFTERDALNRVLAAGRDPNSTKVCEVMTSNPYCVSPEMTVGEAMAVVTKRGFRHLPIVENEKLSAVMSSRVLIHWMVKNRVAQIEELVELVMAA